MGLTIGCAVAAEYIRHFRSRAGHRLELRSGGAGSGSAGTGPESWHCATMRAMMFQAGTLSTQAYDFRSHAFGAQVTLVPNASV